MKPLAAATSSSSIPAAVLIDRTLSLLPHSGVYCLARRVTRVALGDRVQHHKPAGRLRVPTADEKPVGRQAVERVADHRSPPS
jgi:hypothetical protein